jgi:hypothetical protein
MSAITPGDQTWYKTPDSSTQNESGHGGSTQTESFADTLAKEMEHLGANCAVSQHSILTAHQRDLEVLLDELAEQLSEKRFSMIGINGLRQDDLVRLDDITTVINSFKEGLK